MGLSLSVIVLPLCGIMAYKRIPLKKLSHNTLLWLPLFTFSNYMDFRENAQGITLILALLAMAAVFVFGVLLGDALERRFNRPESE